MALLGYGASGTWVPGRYANGLQFDGVDDYVDLTGGVEREVRIDVEDGKLAFSKS